MSSGERSGDRDHWGPSSSKSLSRSTGRDHPYSGNSAATSGEVSARHSPLHLHQHATQVPSSHRSRVDVRPSSSSRSHVSHTQTNGGELSERGSSLYPHRNAAQSTSSHRSQVDVRPSNSSRSHVCHTETTSSSASGRDSPAFQHRYATHAASLHRSQVNVRPSSSSHEKSGKDSATFQKSVDRQMALSHRSHVRELSSSGSRSHSSESRSQRDDSRRTRSRFPVRGWPAESGSRTTLRDLTFKDSNLGPDPYSFSTQDDSNWREYPPAWELQEVPRSEPKGEDDEDLDDFVTKKPKEPEEKKKRGRKPGTKNKRKSVDELEVHNILENVLCPICTKYKANIVLGCGHGLYCGSCVTAAKKSNCPMCRKPVLEWVPFRNHQA